MKERTCPSIYLRPSGNEHGGAFFMSLRTGQRLDRTAWTVLPMPDGVINTVHRLAKTTVVGTPFQNRRREEFAGDEPTTDHSSTGVIPENESEEQTENESDDEEDDYNNDDDEMPSLQERDPYDSDSDDEG
jgi:hypothetical protein